MHDEVRVGWDQRKKHNAHCFYNHPKRRCRCSGSRFKFVSNLGKMQEVARSGHSFAFILDTARTNWKNVLKDNKIDMPNFEFTHQLGKAITPSIQQRYENPTVSALRR